MWDGVPGGPWPWLAGPPGAQPEIITTMSFMRRNVLFVIQRMYDNLSSSSTDMPFWFLAKSSSASAVLLFLHFFHSDDTITFAY